MNDFKCPKCGKPMIAGYCSASEYVDIDLVFLLDCENCGLQGKSYDGYIDAYEDALDWLEISKKLSNGEICIESQILK